MKKGSCSDCHRFVTLRSTTSIVASRLQNLHADTYRKFKIEAGCTKLHVRALHCILLHCIALKRNSHVFLLLVAGLLSVAGPLWPTSVAMIDMLRFGSRCDAAATEEDGLRILTDCSLYFPVLSSTVSSNLKGEASN